MLTENYGLVLKISGTHARKTAMPWMQEDLEQAAAMGFLDAFAKREWDTSYALATFVTWPMVDAMQRAQRDGGASFGSIPWHKVQGVGEGKQDLPPTVSMHVPHAVIEDAEFGDTLGDIDEGYDECEDALAFEQDFEALVGTLSDEHAGWLQDWLDEMRTDMLGVPIRLAERWGVSHATVARRTKLVTQALRQANPDRVKGDPHRYAPRASTAWRKS